MNKRLLVAVPMALLLFTALPTTAKKLPERYHIYEVKPFIIPKQTKSFTPFPVDEPEIIFETRNITLDPPVSAPEVKQVPKKSSVTAYKAPPRPVISKVASKALAQKYALGKVGETQYSCLYKLWNKESGWYYLAYNKASGAYGIPQALPGSKMASAGSDWKTNPITQVKWGLGYVNGRYGGACGAWRFWQSHGWY